MNHDDGTGSNIPCQAVSRIRCQQPEACPNNPCMFHHEDAHTLAAGGRHAFVHGITFDEILLQDRACPLTELYPSFTLDAVTHRNYHIKIVQRCCCFLCKSFSTTVILGMCKFCTYQGLLQFTLLENVSDMTSYNGSVFLKQLTHLLL